MPHSKHTTSIHTEGPCIGFPALARMNYFLAAPHPQGAGGQWCQEGDHRCVTCGSSVSAPTPHPCPSSPSLPVHSSKRVLCAISFFFSSPTPKWTIAKTLGLSRQTSSPGGWRPGGQVRQRVGGTTRQQPQPKALCTLVSTKPSSSQRPLPIPTDPPAWDNSPSVRRGQ